QWGARRGGGWGHAEALEVGPRPAGLHHLDGAAGETEHHVPDRRFAGPVEDVVDLRGQRHLRRGVDERHVLAVLPLGQAASRTPLPSARRPRGSRLSHCRSPLAHTYTNPTARIPTNTASSPRANSPCPRVTTQSRNTAATG